MVCKVPLLPDKLQKRKMRTSPYFDWVLVRESSMAEQEFRESSGDIFQTHGKESFVDVHLAPRADDSIVRAIINCNELYQPKISNLPARVGSFVDLTDSNRPEDKYDHPPTYDAKPELISMKIKDRVELEGVLQKVGKLPRNVLWLSAVD